MRDVLGWALSSSGLLREFLPSLTMSVRLIH
jgi:hypothetical protein